MTRYVLLVNNGKFAEKPYRLFIDKKEALAEARKMGWGGFIDVEFKIGYQNIFQCGDTHLVLSVIEVE